jgi:hypothetical protein
MSTLREEVLAEMPSESVNFYCSPDEKLSNNVHDVHHVHSLENEADAKRADIERHVSIAESVIIQAKDNAGLYAGSEFINAMKFIREQSDEDWVRLRVKIKNEKPSGVLLSDIDEATRPNGEVISSEKNTAAELIALVTSHCDLFYDETTRFSYVTVIADNTTLKVGSTAFIEWLSYAYYTQRASSASDAAVKQAISTVSGICRHEGEQRRVSIRAAKDAGTGAYYLFMGDEKNRALEITATGWRVLDTYPVKFWKPSTQAAIPEPGSGGSINELWEYCNVEEADRLLVLAWLLESMRPETPFPLLELNGVQGSAKSTTQKRLRQIVDPSTANLRPVPKNTEDISVAANNNWLISYENASYLPAKMQDVFCSMATGGAAGGRALYTNGEEFLIEMKRPCMINGIPSLVTAQDLIERTVHLELPRIERYQKESDLNAGFEVALPGIIGGLLDLFVKTLAILPNVALSKPPRMIDFCCLGEAMSRSMGNDSGVFEEVYRINRKESIERALEGSPVALAVLSLVEESPLDTVFHGTYKELLERLLAYKGGDNEGWVKSEKGLANALKRQMPALQESGVMVIPERGAKSSNKGKRVTIKKSERGEHSEHCLRVSTPAGNKSSWIHEDGSPF